MQKGLTVKQFSGLALAFVLVAVIISVGATVLTNTQSVQCSNAGGTWGDYSNSSATYPPSGTYFGCCLTTGTGSGNCTVWKTQADLNISAKGLTGSTTMGNWLPTIAVIIAAAVVIGIIVNYFRQ